MRFINVDLDVESDFELVSLVTALRPGAFPVRAEFDGERHVAAFELSEREPTADETLARFATLLEALYGDAKLAWDRATVRTFSIGFQASPTERTIVERLQRETVARVAALKADIDVTLYRLSEPPPPPVPGGPITERNP